MIKSISNKDRPAIYQLLFAGIIIFSTIYFSLAAWYFSVEADKDVAQAQNHAIIIAQDLWNLNDSGMLAYLDLVARTDHYEFLEVITGNQDIVLKISGPSLETFDKFLLGLGFITSKHISFPVYYEEQKIGFLQGQRYIRYFYPLLYIFIGLFMISLPLIFILYLMLNRHWLEQQIKEKTQRYHDLVNLLPEMVIETDAQGAIIFANKNALKRLGISDFGKFKHYSKDYIQLTNGKNKDVKVQEYKAKSSDGDWFPVLVRSAPIYHLGRFFGERKVIVDITERTELEEQLSRDQKMKSIGIMAGSVAHDLNNILSGIVNYPELILQQIPENSELTKLILPMKAAGLRAAAVVADLLTISRGVAATKEPTNLNDIIQDYLKSPEFGKLQSLNNKIEYKAIPSPELDTIACSVIHLRKSLMNLVNNATEAITEKGQVTITTNNTFLTASITTEYGIIPPGKYVVLSIQDTGEGISSSDLTRIFEPFYSKKELGRSGTGLGLVVVWNTIQDHDAYIRVTSDIKGSTFELLFNASTTEPEKNIAQDNIEMFMGSGETILIVDDELHQRDIASKLLSQLGYRVTSFASGEEAIQYLQTHRVDLVILDMILEQGINGQKTYEKITQIHPDQKAIIISGFSESDDVKITMDMGAGGLVNKPYTQEQLAKAVFKELTKNNIYTHP